MPRTDCEGGRTYTGMLVASTLVIGFYGSQMISGIIDRVCPLGRRTLLSVAGVAVILGFVMTEAFAKAGVECMFERVCDELMSACKMKTRAGYRHL